MAISKVDARTGARWTPGTPPSATRYQVVVDAPPDPATGKRKQLRRRFKTSKEARSCNAQAMARSARDLRGPRPDHGGHLARFLAGGTAPPEAHHPAELRGRVEGGAAGLRSEAPPGPCRGRHQQDGFRDHGWLPEAFRDPGKPLSPRAVRLTLTVLQMALGAAVKRGKLPRNVASLVESPRQTTKRRDVWNGGAITSFLALVGTRTGWQALGVSPRLALRRSEVLGLAWEDLDLDNGLVTIHRNRTQARQPKPPSGLHQVRGRSAGPPPHSRRCGVVAADEGHPGGGEAGGRSCLPGRGPGGGGGCPGPARYPCWYTDRLRHSPRRPGHPWSVSMTRGTRAARTCWTGGSPCPSCRRSWVTRPWTSRRRSTATR